MTELNLNLELVKEAVKEREKTYGRLTFIGWVKEIPTFQSPVGNTYGLLINEKEASWNWL